MWNTESRYGITVLNVHDNATCAITEHIGHFQLQTKLVEQMFFLFLLFSIEEESR